MLCSEPWGLAMRRREFITLVGGAAAWPLAARAQQLAKQRTIGFLGSSTPLAMSQWVAAFVQRLRDLGWIEGRTVTIEYRWAEGRSSRPAGNVTGLSVQQVDAAGKRLGLLREVVPGLRRLAIMANIGNPGAALEMGEAQAAARTLGLEVTTIEIQRAEDIAPGFDTLKGQAEALYVCT